MLPNKQQIAAGDQGEAGKQSESSPTDIVATLTKPEMRVNAWPGEVNAFRLRVCGSWPEPGLIFTTANGHQINHHGGNLYFGKIQK